MLLLKSQIYYENGLQLFNIKKDNKKFLLYNFFCVCVVQIRLKPGHTHLRILIIHPNSLYY